MITNFSGMKEFKSCRVKHNFSKNHRLTAWREADPLVLGGGFHLGAATLFSSGSVSKAQDVAEAEYRTRSEKYFKENDVMILPEDQNLFERNVLWLRKAVALFADNYGEGGVQVIWPEVEFKVELPGTEHHCWFLHNLLHSDNPSYTAEACNDPRCFISHTFKGKTDAIIQWQGAVWLFEHKTNSQTGDIFYQRFMLDDQPTGYMYGIWKSTGMRPHGFLLNVIKKPNAAYKGNPLDRLGFEREAYIRTEEDLTHFETNLIKSCIDYETAFQHDLIYDDRSNCMAYNRKCYFYDLCSQHRGPYEEEFKVRSLDYIEYEYYKTLKDRGVSWANLPNMSESLLKELEEFEIKQQEETIGK